MTQAPAALPAPSPVPALPNLRDLGGWSTADGRTVKSGKLFRSTDFRNVADDAQAALAGLDLRTIYDLRSEAERQALPDPALAGVTDVPLDVLADSKHAIPGNLNKILADPTVVAEFTKQMAGKSADFIAGTYRDLVTMPSAKNSYRRFYLGLLGEDSGPALFHCTTGKDRTGWAAAGFLSLMGVDRDAVYHDYLETNERLLPSLAPLFDEFAAAGGDPEALRPLLGVRREYLDAAFAEVAKAYGDVAGYFAQGLGIDAAGQDRLRDRYLLG
ncbi:tyrosine-protein phosphatase [Gordonia caeni]|uniref:Tyrosine-protein phosphatase n=1 Tax=Gordonia caeni TaxID=1007097 RepID=A0ABP7PRQ1_9ACTN